jgi:Domain of unknown function (DUF4185)
MRVGTVSLSVLTAALALTAVSVAARPSGASSHAKSSEPPAGYLANSTQAVCALTGEHGSIYQEIPYNYTDTQFGLIAGDSGSSFEYDGKVWWLFGNTDPSPQAPWGTANVTSRWPTVVAPLNSTAAEGSDSMAWSSESIGPPSPVAPYNDTTPPPNQNCPYLHFVDQPPPQGTTVPVNPKAPPPNTAYLNPSVYPDPYFTSGPHATKTKYDVSLRRGELPEAGIFEGSQMYVVFGTDNPANCSDDTTTHPGPCVSKKNGAVSAPCGPKSQGSRTRSVMARYLGDGRFEGLYDLSTPSTRYAPLCMTTLPSDDDARFVNVQMLNGPDNFVYIWGTEGGSNNNYSPIYLARIPSAQIATGHGIEYWDGTKFDPGSVKDASAAQPLFPDSPDSCAAQLGIQYNQYLREWIMLYRCNEDPVPTGHPNGIYMRTAANPWGPWSAPTTIFNPSPDSNTESGLCYFIYSTKIASCANLPDEDESLIADSKTKPRPGGDYGPYFVANWTTGNTGSLSVRATTTIYYTLDTFDPYGQLIMRSTILGPRTHTITP